MRSVVCGSPSLFAGGIAQAEALLDTYHGYRGITAAGLDAAAAAGFGEAVAAGLEAATAKALDF